VKQERLEFLSTNASFTHRLAISIGALCRTMTISDVAKRMNLDWHTVKELEKEYMREQLKQKGPPSPEIIGIDEISIKKRHTYKIVVSDLETDVTQIIPFPKINFGFLPTLLSKAS
jgi:transposase